MDEGLGSFSAATRSWFAEEFGEPTPVQQKAWEAISSGDHALVVAPTGSGKTLAAFLHALDRLIFRPHSQGTRVLYISPLKALGSDIERNLQHPLEAIYSQARRLGTKPRPLSVGVRSGDTPQSERSRLRKYPPEILITTPESLYLMLTSSARETLRNIEWVIIDEIHAVAGNKRGTHLALSLERLDLLAGRDIQRIGLSATVKPVDAIASFLGGDRPVRIINPPAVKSWDIAVRTPPFDDPWPAVEQQLLDDILRVRSTLIFTNARRVAEKLTGRLNELWAERGGKGFIARAHHGSVSKELREEIESGLKRGELRAVVATATLELGIDMGAVEQVIQLGAPPSAASALQRIGRAGHQVGATSWGRITILHRGELAAAVVTTADLLAGRIEEARIPQLALDVLAQQTVAEAAACKQVGLEVTAWLAALRRSYPYRELTSRGLDDVLQLLLGNYPSADFADLRARLELRDGRLFPLKGAARLAVTSGGTIPDRGLYGVFVEDTSGGSRRVGELDEEMVHETRVGETFTLGASSWTVVEITRDQVRVVPAAPLSGKMPFWRNEEPSRPAELGVRIGELTASIARGQANLDLGWLDEVTRTELLEYVKAQAAATGLVPDARTVVVERCRDELKDWRVIIHSPLGRAVLLPWATAISTAIGKLAGVDPRPIVTDDGIILRLPDGDLPARVAELIRIDPNRIEQILVSHAAGTGQFAARFRDAATRALLLPRHAGRRMPLWQQRNRAAQLQQVARGHPRFPITVEAVRELLRDEWDLPALTTLLQDIAWNRVQIADVVTETPSPFAANLLFRYAGAFIYEDDLPVSDRPVGLGLDPDSLNAVGFGDLTRSYDADIVQRIRAELQHTAPGRQARDQAELVDLLRRLGPLKRSELAERYAHALPEPLPDPLVEVELGGETRIAARSDLPLLHAALGVPVVEPALPEPGGRDPLVQLIARFARTHTPFTAEELAAGFGLTVGIAQRVLDTEVAQHRLVSGRFTPGVSKEYCDPDVWDRCLRACLAEARARIEPLAQRSYVRYIHAELQRIGSCGSLSDALIRLAGTVLPASLWESHLLPVRVPGYRGQDLDLLLAQGSAVIRVYGTGDDPLIAIVDPDDLDMLPPRPDPGEEAQAFAAALADGLIPPEYAQQAWLAAAAGTIAPASMEPIRAHLKGLVHAPKAARPARARLSRPRRAIRAAPVLPGRWYPTTDEPTGGEAYLPAWLQLYGLVTRSIAEGVPGGWSAVYRDLRQLEGQGHVDRGVFVEQLGPAQFAPPDFLRRTARFRDRGDTRPHLLASLDPANPFGQVLPWPTHPLNPRLARTVGSLVVIADGECLAYLGRGGQTLTLFPGADQEWAAQQVVHTLSEAVASSRLQHFRIAQIDGMRAAIHPLEALMRRAGASIHPQGLEIG